MGVVTDYHRHHLYIQLLVVVNCESQAARAYNFVESCVSSFLILVVFVFEAFKIFNC